MARFEAGIVWEADGDFPGNRYSRAHRWQFDGGAVIPASASPEIVPAPLSDAAAVDPEEALVASAASCHMLWFLSLARDAGFDVLSYRDRAAGTLGRDGDGRLSITRIELDPEVRFRGEEPSPDALRELHETAHDRCFIANSLRTEVVVRDR